MITWLYFVLTQLKEILYLFEKFSGEGSVYFVFMAVRECETIFMLTSAVDLICPYCKTVDART